MDREDSDWIFVLSVYAVIIIVAISAILDVATGWLS